MIGSPELEDNLRELEEVLQQALRLNSEAAVVYARQLCDILMNFLGETMEHKYTAVKHDGTHYHYTCSCGHTVTTTDGKLPIEL